MQAAFIAILEAAAIASTLSIDAFTAGFAYGSRKIKMPMQSVQIVNIICACMTGLSLLAGVVAAPFLPKGLTVAFAFTILFSIGLIKLLDSVTKSIIRRLGGINKEFRASMFNIRFILSLYADPECADIDASRTISSAEAALLAVSLSLDGIAVGFGAALVNVNALAVFLCSFVTNAAAILLGCRIGNRLAAKEGFNISWLGGVTLIALAFSKLM